MRKSKCCLLLDQLKIRVNLGASAKERAQKQTLFINLKITFAGLPKACKTDSLDDTVCYNSLIQKIHEFCHNRAFNLLEALTYQLSEFIKTQLPQNCQLEIELIKTPAIRGLKSSRFLFKDIC